jgi:bifunctional N-acetylglucosamine-1-phosphate-uridyltransferase/glucosamine-1-phosphate-acetyltransferase GlmU-like protein
MKTTAIILAAGKGTRFGSCTVNKTAVLVKGESIIQKGINNISSFMDDIFVVVGHKKDSVISAITAKKINYVTQAKRLGTGHAVKVAVKEIEKINKSPKNILVANGDHLFMIDDQVIKDLLKTHIDQNNDVTILTTKTSNSRDFDNGRIIRSDGGITSILEKTDFTDDDRLINELNTGTYVFKYDSILNMFKKLKSEKPKNLYN